MSTEHIKGGQERETENKNKAGRQNSIHQTINTVTSDFREQKVGNQCGCRCLANMLY